MQLGWAWLLWTKCRSHKWLQPLVERRSMNIWIRGRAMGLTIHRHAQEEDIWGRYLWEKGSSCKASQRQEFLWIFLTGGWNGSVSFCHQFVSCQMLTCEQKLKKNLLCSFTNCMWLSSTFPAILIYQSGWKELWS